MLSALKAELSARVAGRIRELYGVEHSPLVEIPPRRELGDLSFPAGLKLARELRKNPRQIGEEIAAGLELPEVVREVRVEGAGYLNLYLDRPAIVRRLLEEPVVEETRAGAGKVIVEHTNINPNKAAHIGHLRNAVLGDVLARLLRRLGYAVEVQNYIDDTGVQLADVVVAPRSPPCPSPSTTTAGTSTVRSDAGTRRTRSASACAARPSTHSSAARASARRSGGWSPGGCSPGTSRPWAGSTSPTTCSPTRATSWGSTSSPRPPSG